MYSILCIIQSDLRVKHWAGSSSKVSDLPNVRSPCGSLKSSKWSSANKMVCKVVMVICVCCCRMKLATRTRGHWRHHGRASVTWRHMALACVRLRMQQRLMVRRSIWVALVGLAPVWVNHRASPAPASTGKHRKSPDSVVVTVIACC